MTKFKYFEGRILPVVAALSAGVIFGQVLKNANSVRVFESEGRPNIARVYSFGPDNLLVQSSEEPNNYNVPLHEYLKGINDKRDRAIEKA